MLERNERKSLFRSFEFLLENAKTDSMLADSTALVQALLSFVEKAPFLTVSFAMIGYKAESNFAVCIRCLHFSKSVHGKSKIMVHL